MRSAARAPMRSRILGTVVGAIVGCLAAGGCRRPARSTPALPAAATHPAVAAPVATVPATAPPPEAPGRYTLHEWGLVGLDVRRAALATAATQVGGTLGTGPADVPASGLGQGGGAEPDHGVGHGFGTVGKPVFYVHLDPGVSEQRFDLRLGLGSTQMVERWPSGGALDASMLPTHSGWLGVRARAGACAPSAEEAPPTARSSACTETPDHFCEAAEIPRYYGDRASCLTMGERGTELLFYRAAGLDPGPLPLRLVRSGETWTVVRRGDAAVEGPIVWITHARPGEHAQIRFLDPSEIGQPLDPALPARLVPDDVRAALEAESMRRGLTALEAEAFVDAWAPAYFGRCHRAGPEAAGAPPDELGPSATSLIYFAPAASVDTMIPLETHPPARAVHRVFLVREIDGDGRSDDRP